MDYRLASKETRKMDHIRVSQSILYEAIGRLAVEADALLDDPEACPPPAYRDVACAKIVIRSVARSIASLPTYEREDVLELLAHLPNSTFDDNNDHPES